MKSFDTLPDADLDIDSNLMKQMNELKEKIGNLFKKKSIFFFKF